MDKMKVNKQIAMKEKGNSSSCTLPQYSPTKAETTMKGSEHFTRVITEHLYQRAMTDPLFAPNFTKEHKSIEECVTYILTEVYKSGCSGFDDSEIFRMAVHYYDEDDIVVESNPSISSVVVNHHIELTEEEKSEARQVALHRYQNNSTRAHQAS